MTFAARVLRRLERAALHADFLFLRRRRHRRLVLEELGGVSLVVLPDVFHPGLFFSSKLLAEVVGREPLEGKQVLEVGTGSGFLALLAARRAQRTIGTDINPEAVRALRINALLNRLEDKVEARQGDLFASVTGEQFDVIIFNPPYFVGEAKDLGSTPGGTSTRCARASSPRQPSFSCRAAGSWLSTPTSPSTDSIRRSPPPASRSRRSARGPSSPARC